MRDNVGVNVSFHCKDGAGYSTNTAKAAYDYVKALHGVGCKIIDWEG
jgi:hypothetical protein